MAKYNLILTHIMLRHFEGLISTPGLKTVDVKSLLYCHWFLCEAYPPSMELK